MLRSTDGGTTWTDMDPVTEAASVWVDPSDASTLLVGGLDAVYRSTNSGASWQPVATVAVNDVVSRLVPDPAVPHRFWAGTYAAGLFHSDDDGSTWHSCSTGLQAKRSVLGITFSSAGALCAVTLFGVFRRALTASSWTPSSSGITGSEVNSLAYAPSNPVTRPRPSQSLQARPPRCTSRPTRAGSTVRPTAGRPGIGSPCPVMWSRSAS